MYRQWWSRLAALVLLVVAFCCAFSSEAFAEPTVETLPAPEVLAAEIHTHDNGAITVTNNNCSSYPKESKENGAATITSSGSLLSTIPRVEGEWDTEPCFLKTVAGFDNTTYVVQVSVAPNYVNRVIAERNGVRLWTRLFKDPAGCSNRTALVKSMAMGQDGNLYAAIEWGYVSKTCPEKDAFISLDPSTGNIRFIKIVPSFYWELYTYTYLMPYENGVVVLDGKEFLYFNFEGENESLKTFAVPSESETHVSEAHIVSATGRVYWYTSHYNVIAGKFEYSLYYRDPESSTHKIELSKVNHPGGGFFTTPSDGLVLGWQEENGEKGFTYLNEVGAVVYEQALTTETGAIVQDPGLSGGMIVDDSGNVVVRRVISQLTGDHDENIVVDSFSPAGVKTRLFSTSLLGTKGVKDSFKPGSSLTESLANHRLDLMVCHVTGKTEICPFSTNSEIVSISDISMGDYDYPRSAIFKAGLEQLNYVALGDSYSSGEGVPGFIPPSDSDGCHRSYDAYPSVLVNILPSENLRLDAFVACSGAKTTDISEVFKGEQPQLYSLDSDTDIVTVTIGGNDVGFGEFALECVISTCDSSSPAYQYSMEKIAVDLPEKLEKTYKFIHEYAENAEIYVVGYPQVAPEPGVSCTFFTNSEKEAAREVVSSLDGAIKEGVEARGSLFHYVDPNVIGSPFEGHELCMTESYFNGLEIPEHNYSFHPNKRGQQAYAELIAEVL